MCILEAPVRRTCPKCGHSFARVIGTTPGITRMRCEDCGSYFSNDRELRVEKPSNKRYYNTSTVTL